MEDLIDAAPMEDQREEEDPGPREIGAIYNGGGLRDNGVAEERVPVAAGEIFVIPGKQETAQRFVCGEAVYVQDYRLMGVLRCVKRSSAECRAKILVSADGSGTQVGRHSRHRLEPHALEEVAMTNWIRNVARRTPRSHAEVYEEASRKYPNAAEQYVTLRRCSTLMKRARKRAVPRLPQTLQELSPILEGYFMTTLIYRAIVNANGQSGLIFMTDTMREHLNDATAIIANGNYQIPQYIPGMNNILPIDIIRGKRPYTAVVVIMGARSEELYTSVLARICQLSPGLLTNLTKIITHGEKTLVSSLRVTLDHAQLFTSRLFMYQAIAQCWVGSGLSEAPRDALLDCWTLPDVPGELWDRTFTSIEGHLDEAAADFPGALTFGFYLRQSWKPPANVLPAGKGSPKTMTHVRTSMDFISKHLVVASDLWSFLGKVDFNGLSAIRIVHNLHPLLVQRKFRLPWQKWRKLGTQL